MGLGYFILKCIATQRVRLPLLWALVFFSHVVQAGLKLYVAKVDPAFLILSSAPKCAVTAVHRHACSLAPPGLPDDLFQTQLGQVLLSRLSEMRGTSSSQVELQNLFS